MKTVLSIFALIGSLSLAEEVSSPPVVITDEPKAPFGLEKTYHHAAEQVARVTEKAVKQAERALELAQSKIGRRFAWAENSPEPVFMDQGLSLAVGMPGRASAQPLIIRTSDFDSETVSNLQEDLTVMSRILTKVLDRQLGRDGRDSALGIVLSTLPGARRMPAIYLEGYGAIFMLNVRMPLVPSQSREDDESERPVDTSWEEARREIYGQKAGNLVRLWNLAPGESAAEYDADQVEALRNELIEALKNATNLREVKPEQSVTITVIGTSGPGSKSRTKQIISRSGKSDVFEVAETTWERAPQSTLTLQAKKSDIDAYASGSIDADQFRKRVAISAY